MGDYDYSKLKGKIIEICGTYGKFAQEMGLSRQAFHKKIIGKSSWSQDQILKAQEILKVSSMDELHQLFFRKSNSNG